MPKINLQEYRRERARELQELARMLARYAGEICNELYPLEQASTDCSQDGLNDGRWGYELAPLLFRGAVSQDVLPSEATDLSIQLDIVIRGPVGESREIDPCSYLEFNLALVGNCSVGEELRTVSCWWHLDRHLHEEGNNEPEFSHPLYHIQHGGKSARASLQDFGQSLILDAPRLPHPPMDAILGVDFVLSNFFGRSSAPYRMLKDEPDYERMVRNAQQRMWRPYIAALQRVIDRPMDDEWGTNLWPLLLKNNFPQQIGVLPAPRNRGKHRGRR